MTLSTVGYDNADITVAGFQTLLRYAIEGAYRHSVTGMAVTAGGGTRQVVVASGFAVSPGVVTENDANATVTLAANASGSTRTDYIVLRHNAATDTTTIDKVQGASATAPALTQALGGIWEVPLATVEVASGATSLSAGNITDRRPVPRASRVFRGTIAADSVGHASSAKTIDTIDVTDPGWPYRLIVQASARFDDHATGTAVLSANLRGSELTRDVTAGLSLGSNQSAHLNETSDTLTGTASVALKFQASGMSAGSLDLLSNAANHFTVVQIPA